MLIVGLLQVRLTNCRPIIFPFHPTEYFLADQLFVDTLIRLIVRHFEMDPGQLSADSNLQHLGLDSIALAELLVVVEEETGIEVPLTDQAMPVGADVTVAAVADYVARFADESALAVLRTLATAPADADA